MTELEQDLERIDTEAAECLLDIYPGRYVQYVAARLAELGYVRVDAVKEQIVSSFTEWRANYPESVFLPRPVGEHSPTFDGCAGRTMRAMLPAIEKSLLRDIDEWSDGNYCSAGGRVVAKDATGEEAGE